ncbi:MAG: KilA-N domain-containing protein [Hormoscilla sp.]
MQAWRRCNGSQGTWVHPEVAIDLAQWLSPQFRIMVNRWIREWMSGRSQPASACGQLTSQVSPAIWSPRRSTMRVPAPEYSKYSKYSKKRGPRG